MGGVGPGLGRGERRARLEVQTRSILRTEVARRSA